jgi:hypothetical protein
MSNRIPKHSTVAAYLALFLALGTGGASAATALRANSVGTKQIRNGSVRMADLAQSARPSKSSPLFRSAVTDVVSTSDVLASLAGAVKGQPGDPGAPGAQGATGVAGPAAVTTRETVQPVDLQPGQTGGVSATCAPGERLIGGGGRFAAVGQTAATMTQNAPEGAGWAVAFENDGPSAGRVHAFAICAA